MIIQIDLERLSMVNDKGNIENNILDTLRRIKCLIGRLGVLFKEMELRRLEEMKYAKDYRKKKKLRKNENNYNKNNQ